MEDKQPKRRLVTTFVPPVPMYAVYDNEDGTTGRDRILGINVIELRLADGDIICHWEPFDISRDDFFDCPTNASNFIRYEYGEDI